MRRPTSMMHNDVYDFLVEPRRAAVRSQQTLLDLYFFVISPTSKQVTSYQLRVVHFWGDARALKPRRQAARLSSKGVESFGEMYIYLGGSSLIFLSRPAQPSAHGASIETLFALTKEVLALQTRIKYLSRFDPPNSYNIVPSANQ